jgi:hypothetical protein
MTVPSIVEKFNPQKQTFSDYQCHKISAYGYNKKFVIVNNKNRDSLEYPKRFLSFSE